MKKTQKKIKTRFRKKSKNYRKKNKTIRNYAKRAGTFTKGLQTIGRPVFNIGKEVIKSTAQDEVVGKKKFSSQLSYRLNPDYKINTDYLMNKENIQPYKYNISSELFIPPYIKPQTNM